MTLLQISTFLKDYSDYIVLIPSIILSGIVTYWIYLKQNQIKQLSFEYLSNNEIISINEDFKDSIQMYYQGKEAKNVWLTVIKFHNTGNKEINKEDFDSNIKLTTEFADQILSYEIINSQPKNMNIDVLHNSNGLEITPCLLNSKDSFSLKILSNGEDLNLNVITRISGIKSLKNRSLKNDSKDYSSLLGITSSKIMAISIIGILMSFASTYFSISESPHVTVPQIDLLMQKGTLTKENLKETIIAVPKDAAAKKIKLITYWVYHTEKKNKLYRNEGIWKIDLTNLQNQLIEGENNWICIEYQYSGAEVHTSCVQVDYEVK